MPEGNPTPIRICATPLLLPFSLMRGCLEYGINHMEVSRANMPAAGEKSIFSPAAGILPCCNLLSRAGFSAFSRNPCCRHHRRCPGCSCKSLVLRLCLRFERGIIGDSFPALTEIETLEQLSGSYKPLARGGFMYAENSGDLACR